MNKSYFNFLLRSKKTTISFIGVVSVLLYLAVMLSFSNDDSSKYAALATITSTTFAFAYLLVPMTFNYVHSKKAVDSYFALPVSRKSALITTLVSVIGLLVAVLGIATLVTVFLSIGDDIIVSKALLFYVIGVVSLIAVIIFNSAVFLEANSLFDGIVMMAAYALMPLMLYAVIQVFASTYVYGFNGLDATAFESLISLPFATAEALIVTFSSAISRYATIESETIIRWIFCIVWHLAVGAALLIVNYIGRKTERAETVSGRFLSYPFVINFYAFSLLLICSAAFVAGGYEGEYFILYLLIFIAYIIGTFVYRRKIKILIKDVGFFLISVAIAFSVGFVANKTQGFGLAWTYEKNPKNVQYFYGVYENSYEQPIQSEIVKLVKDEVEGEIEYVDMWLSISIDSDSMNKNKEVIDLFEGIRKEAIETYYQNVGNKDYSYNRQAHLNIVNNYYDGNSDVHTLNTKHYNYEMRNYRNLSLSEIKMLSDQGASFNLSVSTEKSYYEFTYNNGELVNTFNSSDEVFYKG